MTREQMLDEAVRRMRARLGRHPVAWGDDGRPIGWRAFNERGHELVVGDEEYWAWRNRHDIRDEFRRIDKATQADRVVYRKDVDL